MAAVSLALAKSFLSVDDDLLDEQIELLLAAAIGDVEAATSTTLMTTALTIDATSFHDLERLAVGPVRAVEEIRYRDPTGAECIMASDRYRLRGTGLNRGIEPIGGWPRGDMIRVDLTVGYGADADDVPAQLRWAILALLRAKFEERDADIAPLIVNHRIWA